MDIDLQDEIKKCGHCEEEFITTANEQKEALSKGIEIKRDYCHDCLKKWRKGEINLEDK